MSRPHLPRAAIDYPESDGKPLAENGTDQNPVFHLYTREPARPWAP